MNEKIAKQLAHMDKLVFDFRMSLSALQSELHESVTVSTTVPTEHYNTTLFDASPQSRESAEQSRMESRESKYGTVPLDKHDEVNVKVSQTEPRYTGEAVLTDPDGFHGKSYVDYERDLERKRVLPE
mgnify:CR=1 FL=1